MRGRKKRTALLFVYGTLMKGLRDDWQEEVGAHLIGRGKISAKLYNLGDYPGAVNARNSRFDVDGELYQLDDPTQATKILDRYEEFLPSDPRNSLFIRKELSVRMEDGALKTAWVYLYNRPVNEANRIPSGNFRNRILAER